jgi:hypothetical protein
MASLFWCIFEIVSAPVADYNRTRMQAKGVPLAIEDGRWACIHLEDRDARGLDRKFTEDDRQRLIR